MIEKILDRLDKPKPVGKFYMARCPSHDDKNPSLKIMETSDGKILIRCFAGCATHDILDSIGLTFNDLFPDGQLNAFKGFQRIEEEVKAKKKDKYFRDEMILAIAKADRAAGKRLTEKDREIERQAYFRLRARNHDAVA